MKGDDLGSRMKEFYEARSQTELLRRTPVIIRLDGKAFHTYTRGFAKPFDEHLITAMKVTAVELCMQVSGCKLAYVQSDEISLLVTDYDTLRTEAWFDYNLQKVVSVSASIATAVFNRAMHGNPVKDTLAFFDARAFNMPKEEVCNYFLWRQQDASRNSLNGYAQTLFSHKQLQNKHAGHVHEMLHEIGRNWTTDLSTEQRRGFCVVKREEEGWTVDTEIPIFSQDRNYIEQWVYLPEVGEGGDVGNKVSEGSAV